MSNKINASKPQEEDETMSNRIPVEKKLSLIEKNAFILDMIYYVGGGMIMTKQLHALLESVGYGSSINNQKAISEMLKNEVLSKKQILASRNHVLILTASTLSCYTGIPSRDINQISTTDKSILNNIQMMEIVINNLNIMQTYYEKQTITGLEIKTYLDEQYSTFTLRPKCILDYYFNLEQNFPTDFWSQSFSDDYSVLKVQKANQKKAVSKFHDVYVNPEDQKIFDELSWIKENCTLSQEQFQQQYFNIHNLINSSCDINYINLESPYKLLIDLVIYDNGSLGPERIGELIAHTYLCFKRYVNSYQPKVYINASINFLSEETMDYIMKDCETRAEDTYGYRKCTKLISQLYNHGCRYPDSTENITVNYYSLSITEKYNIEAK